MIFLVVRFLSVKIVKLEETMQGFCSSCFPELGICFSFQLHSSCFDIYVGLPFRIVYFQRWGPFKTFFIDFNPFCVCNNAVLILLFATNLSNSQSQLQSCFFMSGLQSFQFQICIDFFTEGTLQVTCKLPDVSRIITYGTSWLFSHCC